MQFVQRYSLKLTFALALLLGMQLPGFLQQYEHRLDAHYLEAQKQLLQYQNLADQYFSGDLQALIAKHQHSDVLLFKKEAPLIAGLALRFTQLQVKKKALQGSLVMRLLFLAGELNSPLLLETKQNYTGEVVLNRDSVVVGLVAAFFSSLFVECLFMLFSYQSKRLRHCLSQRKN